MVTRPGFLNLMTPGLSSMVTVSPTMLRSASSPSLRRGIVLTFFLSDLPNPFSGGTSTASSSPGEASARRSSVPAGARNDLSPIETSCGSYRASAAGLAASFEASALRVVLNTSPSPFIDAV